MDYCYYESNWIHNKWYQSSSILGRFPRFLEKQSDFNEKVRADISQIRLETSEPNHITARIKSMGELVEAVRGDKEKGNGEDSVTTEHKVFDEMAEPKSEAMKSGSSSTNPPMIPEPIKPPSETGIPPSPSRNIDHINVKLEFPKFYSQFPRTWLRRCHKYFAMNPMAMCDQVKMLVASMELEGRVEDSYINYIQRLHYVEWEAFSNTFLERHLKEEGINLVDEFSNLNPHNSREEVLVEEAIKIEVEEEVLVKEAMEIEDANMLDEMTKLNSKVFTNGEEEYLVADIVGYSEENIVVDEGWLSKDATNDELVIKETHAREDAIAVERLELSETIIKDELLMEAMLIEGRHMFEEMTKPKVEHDMFDESTKSKLESFAGEEIKACSGDKFQVICLDMGDLGGKIWNRSLTNFESDEVICLKNLFPANRLKCEKPWRMPPKPPPLHYQEEFHYSTSTSIQFTKVMKEINQQTYWIRDFMKKKCCYKRLAHAGDWFSSRSRFWDTPLSIGKEGCWPCNKYLFFVVENGVGNRESGTNMRIGAVASEIWTGDVIYWEFGDNFVSAELEDMFFNLSPAELLPGKPLSKPAEKLLLAYDRPASNVRTKHTSKGGDNFQAEIISFVELVATLSGISQNLHECGVLWSALERSVCTLKLTIVLAKGMFRIFRLLDEKTVASFKTLAAIPRMLKVQESNRFCSTSALAESTSCETAFRDVHEISLSLEMTWSGAKCMKTLMELFAKYFSLSDDAKLSISCTSMYITFMFDLFWEEGLRSVMLKYVLEFKKIIPLSEEDQKAKVFMCSKYLETFTQLNEQVNNFAELSIELLAENEEKLILNVIQMVTCLLLQNETSKVVFNVLEFSASHSEKELFVCSSDDGCKFWGILVSNLENDMDSLDSNSSFIPRRRPLPEPPPLTSWSYLTVINSLLMIHAINLKNEVGPFDKEAKEGSNARILDAQYVIALRTRLSLRGKECNDAELEKNSPFWKEKKRRRLKKSCSPT
ncbi:hypothetical protein ACP275_14G239800 [Erythranthe tilingii]